ncbi:MAG: DUF1311 domain-containing protein, partial [Archangium sp.]|nr:DUF1311 domain-containing protein [Archangium sp.]
EDVFSRLTGKSFLAGVEATRITPSWERADVVRLFEIRHIVCHEMASSYAVDRGEISRCFNGCVAFLRASSRYLEAVLYPEPMMTQAEMNEVSATELARVNGQLQSTIAAVRSVIAPQRHPTFDEAQSKWHAFSLAWVGFEADDFLGGTMWPMMHGVVAAEVSLDRISQLKRYAAKYEER